MILYIIYFYVGSVSVSVGNIYTAAGDVNYSNFKVSILFDK